MQGDNATTEELVELPVGKEPVDTACAEVLQL